MAKITLFDLMEKCNLYHLFDIPYKSPDSDLLVPGVELFHGKEKFIHFFFRDNRHHGRIHLGPGMGAPVRVSGPGTAPLHLLEKSKTPNLKSVKHILHP